jgi:hypothetical protein
MRSVFFLLGLFLSLPAFSAPAHVHGEARLEITIDGNTLAIHFESPLEGLLGFEHAPRTAAEKQAVQTMKVRLEAPDKLFTLPPEAACTAKPPKLESPVFADKAAAGHLDLDADYSWQCGKPSALRGIGSQLFVEFPRLKRIKVEFVGPTGQKSGHMTPKQASYTW